MAPEATLVDAARLRSLAVELLAAVGVGSGDAGTVADSLVDADLRGIHSHGVTRLRIYLERVRQGGNRADGQVSVVADAPAFVLLDGADLLAQIPSARAVELAVERAARYGCAAVAVRGGSHFGAAGYWARLIAERGMAGLSTTNTSPLMVAFGGRTTAVGTNPIAMAFPSSGADPVVVDLATSATSAGALLQAEAAGDAIPESWALGRDGTPTRDPAEALKARRLLPLGGQKGSALAVGVELLAGALAGARCLSQVADMYLQPAEPMAAGHLFLALEPALWKGATEPFADAVNRVQRELAGLPPAAGVERVVWPGQLEAERAAERRVTGIPLPTPIADDLRDLARELGVDTDRAAL